MFSINVLLYGDHPKLASRCLDSIRAGFEPHLVTDIRVGVNSIGNETSKILHEFAVSVPAVVHIFRDRKLRNVLKYPLMRRMLYCPNLPIEAPRVMWFDDDSFVRHRPGIKWLTEVDLLWKQYRPQIMGSPYYPNYVWNEHETRAIRRQPWYAGVPLDTKPTFVTGGWWVADLEFLARWDYPVRELRHNGGDVLLGEICRQQKAVILPNKTVVAINADDNGRESRSIRRGEKTPRPFEHPGDARDYSHHDFDTVVTTYEADGTQRICK